MVLDFALGEEDIRWNCGLCMEVYVQSILIFCLAFGLSCFSIVSATMRRWILPVAVLGMLSVKYTYTLVND
jgi:hypothetical protein